MMARRISIKQMRQEAPTWIFLWDKGSYQFSKWVALLLVGGVFALVFPVLQIRIQPPVAWAAPKASVIYAGGEEGRILSLLAREGGPFPSRFLPSQWEGAAVLDKQLLEGAGWAPQPYVPSLSDLPETAGPTLQLAVRGESVLPRRLTVPAAITPPADSVLAPLLHPLSGITAEELPAEMPAMEGPVDAAMLTGSWRFLLRLDAAGHVLDCVSLAGGDEDGPSPMEGWLRRINFKPDPAKPVRWISVGVEFVNKATTHGADTH